MNAGRVALGAVLVLAVTGGVALLLGPGPDLPVGEAPATTTDAGPRETPAFELSVGNVTKCGTTCRLVNTTLENVGGATARNVTVTVNVSADGDRIWRGEESVGSLAPGAVYPETERVEVGFGGAAAIQANDGYVTIEATVTHEGGRVTFTERRKVT